MELIRKAFLNPGDIFITTEEYVIETILGSCISVCLWDERNKIAGMNHFVFSGEDKKYGLEKNGKYGKISTYYLIKSMLEIGADIKNLKAVVIGGGKNVNLGAEVGIENRKVAFKVLEYYGIKVEREETGGEKGRKVLFDSRSGKVTVNLIKQSGDNNDK